ncbi:hypothetical protein C8T65DRAFT_832234 [Cerioporus squamosus]|nr:hypothetical protein C8T65DRAFT_832234 [Cerioporus squamosus]
MESPQYYPPQGAGNVRQRQSNPRPSPAPSKDDDRQLSRASYKLLGKFFEEVSRYPSNAQILELVEQVRKTGCYWANFQKVRRYFRNRRRKAQWGRLEGPGVKQAEAGVAVSERGRSMGVAKAALAGSSLELESSAADESQVSGALKVETSVLVDTPKRARMRTFSATPLATISNLVGRTARTSHLLRVRPPKKPSESSAPLLSELGQVCKLEDEETPIPDTAPLRLVDTRDLLLLSPGDADDAAGSFNSSTHPVPQQEESHADGDMNAASRPQAEHLEVQGIGENSILPFDPRTNDLATLLTGALDGATTSISAAPRTFKDLGRYLQDQTASVELLEDIRTGVYPHLGSVASDVPRD